MEAILFFFMIRQQLSHPNLKTICCANYYHDEKLSVFPFALTMINGRNSLVVAYETTLCTSRGMLVGPQETFHF